MTTQKTTGPKRTASKSTAKPAKARTPRIPPAKSARSKAGVAKPAASPAAASPAAASPAAAKPVIGNPVMSNAPAPTATPETFSTDASPLSKVPSVEVDIPDFKKQELFAKVAERTGVKKKIAKPVIEAAMEALGDALAEGREVNIPGLGKIKQNRVKENVKARIIIAKIRQAKDQPITGYDPLADAAE